MNIIEQGKKYQVFTTEGKSLELVFCHMNGDKVFVDGISSEELLKVLIDRHAGHARSVQTSENINIETHLRQALVWINVRSQNKLQRKRRKQPR
jgi:molybdopterin-guanine dinucleotide biosynthesis protein